MQCLMVVMKSWKREDQKYPTWMGSGHAREVIVIGSHEEIIEDTFNFNVHEAMPKEGVDAAVV